MFLKKSKNIAERILAIENRLKDFDSKTQECERFIKEKTLLCQNILAEQSMYDEVTNPKPYKEFEDNLKRHRHTLDDHKEKLSDLQTQREFLTKEREKLLLELDEAKLRDLPVEMESTAQEYNENLKSALQSTSILKELHSKLLSLQKKFYSLSDERQKAMARLDKIVPLEIKSGLGELSGKSQPHGFSVRVQENFTQDFLGLILWYGEKLKAYEDFLRTNPKYEETLVANLKKQAEEDIKYPLKKFGQPEQGLE